MTETNVIITMMLAATGHILFSLGAVIQKQGADKALEIGKHPLFDTIKSFLTNKTWLAGAALAFTGLPFYFLAFNYGGLIYIQPMLGLGTLAIVLYAFKILKEKATKTEITGIILIIIGPALIAYGAQNITVETTQIKNIQIIIFYALLYLIVVLLMMLQSKLEKGKKKAVIFAASTGILLGLAAFSGRLTAYHMDLQHILFVFLLLLNLGLGTIMAQIMYQQGRAIITLNISNSFNMVLPVLAGIMILNESINTILLIGLVVIFVGCILLSKIQSAAIGKTNL
jgi:drug/metabolite transporter (DMT)-like permease